MKVAEVLPAFSQELEGLLRAAGHEALARSCAELEFVAPCGCGDDFCAGFYTAPKPTGSWGDHQKNLLLSPASGMVILDVVDGRIAFVEVLYRKDVRGALLAATGSKPKEP